MIKIQQSKTADTRSCDFAMVSKETLIQSSVQHISDVAQGMEFISNLITEQAKTHDFDKIEGIDSFHSDFIGGFKNTAWWDNHRKVNRHHLLAEDGVPSDVNLVDVIEMIVDCVTAGMARTGTVYPLDVSPELLVKAFNNTAALLKTNIEVVSAE